MGTIRTSLEFWLRPTMILVLSLLWTAVPTDAGGCLKPGGGWPLGPINVAATAGDLVVYSRGTTIEIANIADPSTPVVLGATEIAGNPAEIAIEGSLAFVAADDEGFFVVDFSDPADPAVVGHWGGAPEQAWDIAASGDYVYVAYGRLIVVDVSDPTAPVEAARESTWSINSIELVGHHVYAISSGLLVVYDVSDPTAPSITHHLSDGYYRFLAANSERLLTTYAGRISVFTLADPAVPVFVSEYDDPTAYFQTLAIDGTHAYLTTYNDEFAVVDTTDPTDPTTVSIQPSPGNPRNVAAAGATVYLTTQEGGLRLFDASDPTTPTEVGSIPASGASNDLAIDGTYAFVAQRGSGLRIFEVSNPDDPAPIGFLTLDDALGVTLEGTQALVTAAEAGIYVADVSNPENPILLGGFDTPDRAWKGEIIGDLAYVADGDSGLRIYDISDPAAITEAGAMTSVNSATDVAIAGDVAYLADCNWGLATVDVSHPSAPTKLFGDGSWDNFCAQAVVVMDNYAILVEGRYVNNLSGIRIYDVTDPAAPVWITDFEQTTIKWVGWDLAIEGDTLYVAYERATVAFDLSNPLAPALIGHQYTPGLTTGVDVVDGRVFIAAYTGGIASAGCATCSDAIFADGWNEWPWYGYTAWSSVNP